MEIYSVLLSHPDVCSRYAARYIKFITTRSNVRELSYTEKHHILPKSMFPDYARNTSNIVALSAREHYLAHRLLTRVFPTSSEMKYAFWCMCNGWQDSITQNRNIPKVNSRVYSEAKSLVLPDMIRRGKLLSDPLLREKSHAALREIYGGVGNGSDIIFTKQKETMLRTYGYDNIFLVPDFIEKNRQATIDRNKDSEYRKSQGLKIAKALESVDRKGENNSFYGKTHSDETKDKIRAAKTGKTYPQFSCLCCRKTMGANNFTQHTRRHDLKQLNDNQSEY
jgi:hypothetical protein